MAINAYFCRKNLVRCWCFLTKVRCLRFLAKVRCWRFLTARGPLLVLLDKDPLLAFLGEGPLLAFLATLHLRVGRTIIAPTQIGLICCNCTTQRWFISFFKKL